MRTFLKQVALFIAVFAVAIVFWFGVFGIGDWLLGTKYQCMMSPVYVSTDFL